MANIFKKNKLEVIDKAYCLKGNSGPQEILRIQVEKEVMSKKYAGH